MEMDIGMNQLKMWLQKAYEKFKQNRDYLTELDQKIGDGDHGINMERGFNKVAEKLSETEYDNIEAMIKDVAMTVISNVGGAAGPLYGTAFLRMAPVFGTEKAVNYETLREALEAGLKGIQERGKAEKGEKTLIDVWIPVVERMQEQASFESGALKNTAKEAAENTKNLMATKGRAAYFKEKSIGHIDPGAMSSAYLFTALAEAISGESA